MYTVYHPEWGAVGLGTTKDLRFVPMKNANHHSTPGLRMMYSRESLQHGLHRAEAFYDVWYMATQQRIIGVSHGHVNHHVASCNLLDGG